MINTGYVSGHGYLMIDKLLSQPIVGVSVRFNQDKIVLMFSFLPQVSSLLVPKFQDGTGHNSRLEVVHKPMGDTTVALLTYLYSYFL